MPQRGFEHDAALPSRPRLEKKYARAREQYENAARVLEPRLRETLRNCGVSATLRVRVKSFDSYFEKLLKLKRPGGGSRAEITDLLGVRIICPFLADLERVETAICAGFEVAQTEYKGSSHSFREFGYDSTHLLIKLDTLARALPYARAVAEIQLRTILQDAWAEVEHELVYKATDSLLKGPVKRKLASLNATLTLSDLIFQEIRDYQQEVEKRENRRRGSLAEQALPENAAALSDPGPAAHAALARQHGSVVDRLIFEALAAHSNSQFMEAIAIYSRLLRMNLDRHVRSIIYNHRGMSYFVLSQYRKSVDDFTQALRYNPANFNACNNRALAYRVLHQYDRALADLDRSLGIDDTQADGYYIRALTHFDLQDFAKALADCERVLNLKPGFAAAQHFKSVVAAQLSR